MSITTIYPKQLHEIVQAGQDVELIDVRTPVEFREVHVSFARNVPLDQLDAAKLPAGRNGASYPLYFICQSGESRQAGVREISRGGLHERGQCRRGHAGLGPGGAAGCSGQEGDFARTAGAHRGRVASTDRCATGLFRSSLLDRSAGIRRGWSLVRWDHRHLRHGNVARADAVESGSQ